MFEIKQYTQEYKSDWDTFIQSSKNGTFLFMRNYMDYHSDRFADSSFMFYRKGKLEAVLPGNIKDDTFYSHQGLTYGGLLQSAKVTTIDVLSIFGLLNQALRDIGIVKVIYKPVPLIYHQIPAQEDLYALFKLNAVKIGCNISSTIYQNNKIRFNELRRRGVKKSSVAGVTIIESDQFDQFWSILKHNLENRYNKAPVHSLIEIDSLYKTFQDNIKLYTALLNNETIAGVVLYITANVIHVQYIAATDVGKSIGALDFLFNHLINDDVFTSPIFDFGQSTENLGNYLNENLIFQKEGFGGRGTVYEIYEYNLS